MSATTAPGEPPSATPAPLSSAAPTAPGEPAAPPIAAALPPKPASAAATTATTVAINTPIRHLTIDKTALVCDKAILEGTITIAANTIIHPRARLIAPPSSTITIGANSIIEDTALISPPPHTNLTIGNWVLIEPMATLRSSIGHANHIRAAAVLAETARVGRGVEIGVRAVVDGAVEDGSVVGSDGSERRASEGGWTVREREKRVMELIQLQLMASRDLLVRAHKMIR